MTTEELRELDYWIARNVMEWQEAISPMSAKYPCFILWSTHVEFCKNALEHSIFSPTTSPADAMEVLKRCAEKAPGQFVKVAKCDDGEWIVSNENMPRGFAKAKTLEIAAAKFAKALFSK